MDDVLAAEVVDPEGICVAIEAIEYGGELGLVRYDE
jgi:hypothetical protein